MANRLLRDFISPTLFTKQGMSDALITATICCVTVLSSFLTGAASVAITTIGRDLHFKQSDLQWPLNVYALSVGCLLLLCGRLADILGNKKLFLIGSAWFSIWSIAAAFAQTPWSFILFIGMQGIGSAANTPSGISILSSHFPPGKAKNRAFSILGAGQAIGFIIGMILGGILAESASWRAIFWLQAGLGCLLCVVGWFVIPNDDPSRRYHKGLDVIGAVLSTAGLGLLVYDLGESTATPKGWATPFIPSLFSVSILLLGSFVAWELRREAKGQSVLLPMSMWSQPGAKMGPVILLVIFCWWGFNALGYFIPLYLQQVRGLSPLQTALQVVPQGVSGLIANLATGYLIAKVRGQFLVAFGLIAGLMACILYALIDIEITYWAMAFFMMLLLPILDITYTVANMHVCTSFNGDSQALAGGIFNVATRLGTSIGLAVTSTIANSVSEKFNKHHPDMSPTDPAVLMAGFRAAGWTCCGALGLSLLIAVAGMRGIGLVGQQTLSEGEKGDIELGQLDRNFREASPGPSGSIAASSHQDLVENTDNEKTVVGVE